MCIFFYMKIGNVVENYNCSLISILFPAKRKLRFKIINCFINQFKIKNMVGYSGTPLYKKLGIKSGKTIYLYKPPENYFSLLEGMPEDVKQVKAVRKKIDFIQIFAKSQTELVKTLKKYRQKIKDDGMIWVSWYKKASKIPTDITEDTIREIAFELGLVDIKVCAVDEKWSGLKLVIRKALRGK